MKDFLTRLASRAIENSMAVRPRTPTIFEPARSLEFADDSTALRAGAAGTERLQEEPASGPLALAPSFSARLEALETIFGQVRSAGDVSSNAGSGGQSRALPTPNPLPVAPAIQLAAQEPAQEAGRADLPVGLDARRVLTGFIAPIRESGTEPATHEVSDRTKRPRGVQNAIPDSPPAEEDVAHRRPDRSLQPAAIVRLPRMTQDPAPADGPAPKSSSRPTVDVRPPEPVESPPARPSPQAAPRQMSASPAIVVPSVRLAPLFPPPTAAVTPSPIQVTIGRLEIRAVPPPAGRQRPARRPAPVVGLEEYLCRRTAGGAA